MSRKLSVVVPVYNSEKYLCQCIDSILNQTYSDIELILVNDGSTDASGEICNTYAERDRRVSVIHKENEGPIKARLIGAERTGGEYITFVDSDDWIDLDAYEQMMQHMERSDVVMAGIYRYYAEDKIKADIPMLREGSYDRTEIEREMIPCMLWSSKRDSWELDPSLCTKVFKKDLLIGLLRQVGNLDIHFGEDIAVVYPFILEADSAVIVHNCYYYHRQRSTGNLPPYFLDEDFFVRMFSLYEYLKINFLKSTCWDRLSPQLEHFYVNAVQLKKQVFADYIEEKKDVFPFWEVGKGAWVVLYGAGEVGQRYYEQNERYHFCNIVLWVDQNYQKLHTENECVVSPDNIYAVSFDYLIIAVRSARMALDIRNTFIKKQIPTEKIIWNGVAIQRIVEGGEGFIN